MPTHQTSWTCLVSGLLFIGVGVLLLTDQVDLVARLSWVAPIVLIVVAIGLIASAVGGRPGPAPGASWAPAPGPAVERRDPAPSPADDDAGAAS
jgi:hypothetical protein